MTSVHTWNEFLGQQAQDALAQQHPDNPIEVVVYRDPDERDADGVDVQVLIHGRVVDATVFVVDPGAGYSLDQWRQDRDADMATASPAAAKVIGSFYDTGEATEFIEGPASKPEPTGTPT